MATPRLDKIIVEFGRRIGAPPIFNNNVLGSRYDLENVEYVAYINKALLKFFTDSWNSLQADKQKFINTFPELVKRKTVLFFEEGYDAEQYKADIENEEVLEEEESFARYVYADKLYSNMGDLFTLLGGRLPLMTAEYNNFFEVVPRDYLNSLLYGLNTHILTQNSHYRLIIDDMAKVYVFPSIDKYVHIEVSYIQLPVKENGDFLTQNGDTDVPYSDNWNSTISEVAEQIFKTESQENA